MSVFYQKEGFVEANVLDQIITVRWQKLFNSAIIKECCEAQLQKVIEEGAKIIVVDTTNSVGKPSEENQSWFGTHLFPAFNTHGLKALITVMPKNRLAKQGADQWQKTGAPFGFDIFETTSLIMARKKAREILGTP